MAENKEREYTTVSISIELMKKVDDALAKGNYQNRADFVRDAIRKQLAELSA